MRRAALPLGGRRAWLLVFAGIVGSWAAPAHATEPSPSPWAGERIYREGILPSGEPLTAVTMGDVPLVGPAAACVSCHRRSGYGGSEGGLYVPPVTAPELFRKRELSRGRLLGPLYQDVQTSEAAARVRSLENRPAYDDRTLLRALTEGVDPNGEPFHPAMPRYEVPPWAAVHLLAYLRTLSAEPAPGVTEDTLYLATVVTPEADPAETAAMREVIDAFVERKNREVVGMRARPGHSPMHRDDLIPSYRHWRVDEWTLRGPPETWRTQLDERSRERPVFALLAGLGPEAWWPVHHFCEENRVPCLLPNVVWPETRPQPWYSVYADEGVVGEARAIAEELGEEQNLFQVVGSGAAARAAAAVLHGEVTARGGSVRELRWHGEPRGPSDLSAETTLVLWLDADELASLFAAGSFGDAGTSRRFLLSGHLLGSLEAARSALPEPLAARAEVAWPWALPSDEIPRRHRVLAWLRSRGLAAEPLRVRLQTHLALTLADLALHHLVDRYSREYFLEVVEHEMENGWNPGTHRRMTLSPDERFASSEVRLVPLVAEGR